MKKYVFEARHSYSSHPDWNGNNSGDYNEIPKFAILPDGSKVELDLWELFATENYTKAGYAIHSSGLKFRKDTISKSPDYDKRNGNGCYVYSLSILSPFTLKFEY